MPLLFTRSARRGQRLAGAVRSSDNALVTTLLSRHGAKHFVDWAPAPNGHTPLSYASQTGNLEAAVMLLNAGADPKRGSEGGCTPLHWAAWRGHLHVLELLLDRGSPVGHRSQQGCTALDYACFFAQSHCVRSLLARGADARGARDASGRAPLHWAAQAGCTGSISALLSSGAEVDARDGGGSTALMFASRSGCAEAAALLLRHGADAAATNADGHTAAAQAGRKNPERAQSVLAVLAAAAGRAAAAAQAHAAAAAAATAAAANGGSPAGAAAAAAPGGVGGCVPEPDSPTVPVALEAWLGALQLGSHGAALCRASPSLRLDASVLASVAPEQLAAAGITPRGVARFGSAARALATPESRAAAAAAAASVREENAQARQCVVCLSRDADTAFTPCGHVACCAPCAAIVMAAKGPRCPCCRAATAAPLKLFYVS